MESGDTGGVLGALIDASHFVPPDRLAELVAHHAGQLGALETVVYLTSVDQRQLRPLTGTDVPERPSLDIDGTVVGKAFRDMATVETKNDDLSRLWLPLLDGTARVGVMEVVTRSVADPDRVTFRQFAGLVAELVVSRGLYGDTFTNARRSAPVSLGAELQWSLLPPLTFDDGRTTVSAILEPAHHIAGDSFDYAYNGDLVDIAIIDAIGHGSHAALVAATGVAAYRNARRAGGDLRDIFTAMDHAVSHHCGAEQFLTAYLCRLDAATGRLTSLNCGHPSPLHVRNGSLMGNLPGEPSLPVGLSGKPAALVETQLEPEDVLLLYSDGVVEARNPEGEFFGERRLADLLVRAVAARLPPVETPRRLVQTILEHQQNHLQDDATAVLVQWHGPTVERSPSN